MTEAREACIHHWLLESPNGKTSKGTCKKCGSERDYYNALEEGNWTRENNWTMKQRLIRLAKVSGSKGSI